MNRFLALLELESVAQDAHGLYRRFGFAELDRPERYMERPGGGRPAG